MLNSSSTPLFISSRFHLHYWIGFRLVVLLLAFLSPGVACSFHHQRVDDTATAFLLMPSSTTRHYRHFHHHNAGLLYHSLYPRIVSSSSSVYDSAIPSTTTSSTWRSPISGRYSLTLKATPRGPSNNHQNRRQQSRPPQQFLTVTNILDNYIKNRNNLKPYQVGLVWNKLGKAVQQSRNTRERQNFWADNSTNLRTLVVHTMQSVDDFDGQSTATVTHSLAKLMSLTDSNLGRVQSLWNVERCTDRYVMIAEVLKKISAIVG